MRGSRGSSLFYVPPAMTSTGIARGKRWWAESKIKWIPALYFGRILSWWDWWRSGGGGGGWKVVELWVEKEWCRRYVTGFGVEMIQE